MQSETNILMENGKDAQNKGYTSHRKKETERQNN